MPTRNARIALSVLIVVLTSLLFATLRYPGRVQVKLPPGSCDATLWKHVYEPGRLHVFEACTAVEGQVVSVHRSSDGDLHIGLKPDNRSVLNLVNVIHAGGTLVVEAICDHPPAKQDEGAACGSFHSQVAIPSVGDRVRVTGSYVKDRDNGWNEIHPVTRIETLP